MTTDVAPPLCNKRYRLVGELGSGGAATVFRAYDALLGVWRAVKVLSPRMAGKQKVRERFLNEARTMARLKHPHIVTVYDVGIDGDRVYMVMETLEGGCVMDRVKLGGPLPARMASAVIQALLSGLGEAHLHGVVHRDVKPHNVLISKEGVPKLIDFGIAQHADRSLTKTGAVIGTWAYMAPEQRTNAKGVDPRSDLYSTGATLYAIMTGKDPFDLYATDLHGKLFAGLPEPLVEVMKAATRYESDDRYDSAAEMFHALQAAHRRLPADPLDTPPLALVAEDDLNLPELTDFEDLEEATGQSRRQHADDGGGSATTPAVDSSDNPHEMETRVLDGVSIHDSGQGDFAFFASPADDYSDVPEPPEFDGGNLGRVAFGIALVAVVGTGIGIGAAVFMEDPQALTDPETLVEDTEPASLEEDVGSEPLPDAPPVAHSTVESGITIERPGDSDTPEPDSLGTPEVPPDAPLVEEAVDPVPPTAPVNPPRGLAGMIIRCDRRAGDALLIDGVKVGSLPVEIVLEPGDYGFVIEGDSGSESKLMQIQAGQSLINLCG